jgi:ribosomal protein S18 acetylase RimI-like enzyme
MNTPPEPETGLEIYQIQPERDRALVDELFWEYLQWATARFQPELGVDLDLDVKALHEQSMRELHKFTPPHGRLLLARQAGQVAGVACMRTIEPGVGEIKRMYVRPAFRRQGIGRALAERLLSEARAIGYTSLRLDSTRFMHAAHALYRSLGFREIEPYPESEIPPQFQSHWIFMELNLR